MRSLPDVLFIGPMKTATTWVYSYLATRDDIGLPRGVKETFFFDRRFHKGENWYVKHFLHIDPAKHRRIVEVAPTYFHSLEAPQRVFKVLGNVTLVATLRNPVERAWSHYLHLRRHGYTRAELREAVKSFPEVLEASRYRPCLERWYAAFGDARVHILYMQKLLNDPDQYAKALCEALEIPFIPVPDTLHEKYNASVSPRFPRLAAIGTRAAHWLRSYRLNGVVNLAKALRLRGILLEKSGRKKPPALTEHDAEWLADELRDVMPDTSIHP